MPTRPPRKRKPSSRGRWPWHARRQRPARRSERGPRSLAARRARRARRVSWRAARRDPNRTLTGFNEFRGRGYDWGRRQLLDWLAAWTIEAFARSGESHVTLSLNLHWFAKSRGCAVHTVRKHLRYLEERGLLQRGRAPGRSQPLSIKVNVRRFVLFYPPVYGYPGIASLPAALVPKKENLSPLHPQSRENSSSAPDGALSGSLRDLGTTGDRQPPSKAELARIWKLAGRLEGTGRRRKQLQTLRLAFWRSWHRAGFPAAASKTASRRFAAAIAGTIGRIGAAKKRDYVAGEALGWLAHAGRDELLRAGSDWLWIVRLVEGGFYVSKKPPPAALSDEADSLGRADAAAGREPPGGKAELGHFLLSRRLTGIVT